MAGPPAPYGTPRWNRCSSVRTTGRWRGSSAPRSWRPQVYGDAELELILGAINRQQTYGSRNIALIRLMVDGGLRLNEACELRLEDVDWHSGRIHVRWQSAKRNKERETSVGRGTLLDLRHYVEDFRPRDIDDDHVFIDQDGGPLTTHAVQCMLGRLRRKLGLKRLTAHQFRRTWATNYRKLGVGDLYDLQQEGGWEDLSVPLRFYVDVGRPAAGRTSVLDLWEQSRVKGKRGQNLKAVQGIQVRGLPMKSRVAQRA